ncbi:MAG: SCO family protein [Ignavibacteria bacterium]|jgi:protein SCO1/2
MKKKILYILLSASLIVPIYADDRIEVGIDEQLGSNIALDVSFKDASGKDVILRDLISSSGVTILAFVYYRCPAICSPLLFEISDIVNRFDLELGYDYNIISISIDELETPNVAKDKKRVFISALEEKPPDNSWLFLTGKKENIEKLTASAGFYFQRDGEQFKHTAALVFVDKDGKICRYIFPGYTDKGGFSILPFDFKMAVLETDEGRISPTIAKVLQFCFSYDPEGKSYVLNITRIFGAGILLLAAIFLIVIIIKPKKEIVKAR